MPRMRIVGPPISTLRRIGRLWAWSTPIAIVAGALACGGESDPGGPHTATTTAGGTGGSVFGAGGFGVGSDICDAGAGGASVDAGTADASCDAANEAVSFTGDVQPVLTTCTGELCHAPPDRDALVGQRSAECCDGRLLVAPGDADHSYLVDKIEGHDLCGGGPMPLGAVALTTAEIQSVRDWICVGAPEN